MKKQSVAVLIWITILFCTFTLGFYLGRNYNHETILLSPLPTDATHQLPPVSVPEALPVDEQISYPININTASEEELSSLPGIGDSLAKRIILFRDLNGPFSRPEELMDVSGIGTGKYENILNYIYAGG